MIEELRRTLSEHDVLIEKLRKENVALKEARKLSAKDYFGRKNQKLSSRDRDSDSRESDKEDFDNRSTPSLPSDDNVTEIPFSRSGKQDRPYRKGMSYKCMRADKSVCHDSDLSRLPKDAVIIKTFYKYSYVYVSYILKHKYQVVRYKRSDGKILEGYFPKAAGPIRLIWFPEPTLLPISWPIWPLTTLC